MVALELNLRVKMNKVDSTVTTSNYCKCIYVMYLITRHFYWQQNINTHSKMHFLVNMIQCSVSTILTWIISGWLFRAATPWKGNLNFNYVIKFRKQLLEVDFNRIHILILWKYQMMFFPVWLHTNWYPLD